MAHEKIISMISIADMDTNSNATINNENSEIEHDNAEKAFIEFRETGSMNSHCLRFRGNFFFMMWEMHIRFGARIMTFK